MKNNIDDNDNVNLDDFARFLNEDIERNKNYLAKEFSTNGNIYLDEIKRKKEFELIEKNKKIKYIIKHKKFKYSYDELIKYDILDIRIMYDEIKYDNKFLQKLSKTIVKLLNLK